MHSVALLLYLAYIICILSCNLRISMLMLMLLAPTLGELHAARHSTQPPRNNKANLLCDSTKERRNAGQKINGERRRTTHVVLHSHSIEAWMECTQGPQATCAMFLGHSVSRVPCV